MEVAGVVLGAVPLILHALDNYGKVWDPVKQAWRWEETFQTIRNQIFLQKEQLDTTLETLGLADATMAEVEYALQIHHPLQCKQFMRIICEMDGPISDISSCLYPDADGPPDWAYATSGRVRWEWRRVKRGFGSKKRKEIVKQLQSWNSALRNCGLGRREIPADSQNRIINLIRERFDDGKTKTIRANANAVHEAIGSGFGCNCANAHKGNIQLNWHENKPLAASAFYLAFSTKVVVQGQLAATNVSWKTMSMIVEEAENDTITISGTTLPVLPPIASSPPAMLTPPPILQQRNTKTIRILRLNITKESSPQWKSPSPPATPSPATVSRTTLINTLTPPESLSPASSIQLCGVLQSTKTADTSLGYLPIPSSNPRKRLRVISKDAASAATATTKRITHLHSLLSRTIDATTNRKLALSRKQRFGVAAALTWAVPHLYGSPWLAKTLNNEGIHMFLENQNGATTSNILDHPYISYDFHPTPSNPGTPAPAPPPSVQFQSNQIPNPLFFTLGIRLIELGRNLPFPQIRQEYNTSLAATSSPNPPPAQAQTPTAIDDFEIAKAQYDELCLDPGPTYANAVDRCLKFLFPGNAATHTFEDGKFRKMFFEDVVAPTQATFELIPGSYSQLVSSVS